MFSFFLNYIFVHIFFQGDQIVSFKKLGKRGGKIKSFQTKLRIKKKEVHVERKSMCSWVNGK